jgi:hypothetical protein
MHNMLRGVATTSVLSACSAVLWLSAVRHSSALLAELLIANLTELAVVSGSERTEHAQCQQLTLRQRNSVTESPLMNMQVSLLTSHGSCLPCSQRRSCLLL